MQVTRMNIGEKQVLVQIQNGEVFVLSKDDVSVQGNRVQFSNVLARRKKPHGHYWKTEVGHVVLSGDIVLTKIFVHGCMEPNAEGEITL